MKTKIEKLISMAMEVRDMAKEFKTYGEYRRLSSSVSVYIGDEELRYSAVTFDMAVEGFFMEVEFKVVITNHGNYVTTLFGDNVESYLDRLIDKVGSDMEAIAKGMSQIVKESRERDRQEKIKLVEKLNNEIKTLEGEL